MTCIPSDAGHFAMLPRQRGRFISALLELLGVGWSSYEGEDFDGTTAFPFPTGHCQARPNVAQQLQRMS